MFCSMLKWVREKERRQENKGRKKDRTAGGGGREANDKVQSKANKVSMLWK